MYFPTLQLEKIKFVALILIDFRQVRDIARANGRCICLLSLRGSGLIKVFEHETAQNLTLQLSDNSRRLL